MGLATDYCVKYTILDAIKGLFSCTLHAHASRGVTLNPEDSELAIKKMKETGALIIN